MSNKIISIKQVHIGSEFYAVDVHSSTIGKYILKDISVENKVYLLEDTQTNKELTMTRDDIDKMLLSHHALTAQICLVSSLRRKLTIAEKYLDLLHEAELIQSFVKSP